MNKKRAVVAIVNFNGKILIGKKRYDSPKFLAGEWHIPGETAEAYESDKEALIRGIKEEAGINIIAGRYVASHKTPKGEDAKWYECFAETDIVKPGSDLEDAMFVPRKEVFRFCSEKAYSRWSREIIDYFS